MSITVTLDDAPGRIATAADATIDGYRPTFTVQPDAFGVDLTSALANLLTPEESECAHCGRGVGAILAGDADERTEWRPVALILDTDAADSSQAVATMCPTCAATN